jgi:hypothetical protein
MRDLHLRVQARHLLSAELHELLAGQLEGQHRGQGAGQALMTTVADRLGAASAAAALGGGRHAAVVAASDEVARAAHDLELVFAEGPATEAADGAFVSASGRALLDRWPRYGPAAAELGIRAVCAAPLRPADVGLGALCAYDPAAESWTAAATRLMSEALSELLTSVPGLPGLEPDLSFFGSTRTFDHDAVVHQAVGILSVQCSCELDEAADLLAARAFADGRPLPEVAMRVLAGDDRPL